MASDGTEETTFIKTLREELVGIPALARWLEPHFVVRKDTIDEALETVKFSDLLIVLHDVSGAENPHSMGASGDFEISVFITAVLKNKEGATGSEPADMIGDVDAVGPSLAIVDGAIRNALHDTTLGGFCYSTRLLGGDPYQVEIPVRARGRQYLFTAYKEVTR